MLIPWDLLLFVIGVIGMPGAPLKWKPGLGTRINICRALLKYRVSPNLCKAITGVCVLVDRDWEVDGLDSSRECCRLSREEKACLT